MNKFAVCNELFDGWAHEQAIDCAAELGYTGVEVAPFTLGHLASDVTASQRSDYRKLVESAGLEIIGLHWLLAKTEGFHLTSRDKEIRQKTLEYFKDLTRLASDLGGSLMVLGSPLQRNFVAPVSESEARQFTIELLEHLIPTLESSDVVLAIEPLGPEETNFIQTAAEAQTICDHLDSPSVRLHLDVKAMSTEPDSIENIIREQAGNIAHFHANDPNRLGPGMGEVEFSPILKALRDVQYDGWLSVEVFDFSPGPRRIAHESIDYLKRVLGER
jgi:sugar phosphate isomerase/epimerase